MVPILLLIECIIAKYFHDTTKYRIVKCYSKQYNSIYKLQESFLLVFWITVAEYPAGLCSIEEVKRQIERFKRKTKKEVVYKE
jgi:hypothetical protein